MYIFTSAKLLIFRHLISNLYLGKIGIAIDSFWYEPATNSNEDKYLAEVVLQMNVSIKNRCS